MWRIGAVRGLLQLNDVDADGKHGGIGAEYVEAVARQLGVGLHLTAFDSVAAMLDALRKGTIDIVPFLTLTSERRKEFAFSAPYVEMPYMLVARSDDTAADRCAGARAFTKVVNGLGQHERRPQHPQHGQQQSP